MYIFIIPVFINQVIIIILKKQLLLIMTLININNMNLLKLYNNLFMKNKV